MTYIDLTEAIVTAGNTALVTGATGFVGSHLTELLIQEGYQTKGLVRATSNLRWVDGLPVQMCTGCLEEEESLEHAVADVDVVFHAAAITTSCDRKDYVCVNVEGTRRLFSACRRSRARRIVFISSAAAQGPSPDGHPMTEDDEPHPLTPYGRSKLEAERVIRDEFGDLEWVILRPPAVYGPRDTDLLELFRSVNRGLRLSLGWGSRWQSLIHVRDLARGALLAATASAAAGGTYNICSPRAVEWKDVQDAAARALGVRARHMVVPSFLIYPVALWRQLRGRIVGRAPALTLPKVPEILARHWILDPSRAERDLGFRAEIPLDEGIRETAEWYRSHGWLS